MQVEKAKEAAASAAAVDDAPGTLFDKIIDGTIPANIVYQVR